MIFYINNISIPYTKISFGKYTTYSTVSFLIDKSEISTILPLCPICPPMPYCISTIIYTYKDKWFVLETSLHHIYEDVHRFPNLFELKFFGKEREISTEDIRELKIDFLINN